MAIKNSLGLCLRDNLVMLSSEDYILIIEGLFEDREMNLGGENLVLNFY